MNPHLNSQMQPRPPERSRPPSSFRALAIGLTVFALVGMTVVIVVAIAFAMSMNSWGNNK